MAKLKEKHIDLLNMIKESFHYETKSFNIDEIKNSFGFNSYSELMIYIHELILMGYIDENFNIIKELGEENSFFLPFYGFAQCGNYGKEIFDYYPREKFSISINDLPNGELKNYFVTRAKGDSMLPFIESGDNILIKSQPSFDDENDLLLVIHNNRPKIKKVKNINGKVYLVSLNSNHNDIELEEFNDNLEVIGVVKKNLGK